MAKNKRTSLSDLRSHGNEKLCKHSNEKLRNKHSNEKLRNKHSNEKLRTIRLKKDPDGYYQEDDLKLLNPIELLELLIDETSYQDTMNEVRQTVVDYLTT